MTAQQQLAELLQIKRDYIDPLGPAAKTKPAFDKPCADFIRDHGPAIAELIEVAEIGKSMRDAYIEKFGPPDDEVVVQLHTRFDAALRKLTQDATT